MKFKGCTFVEDNLSQYLEGFLGEASRLSFEAHLAECDDCRKLLEEQKSLSVLLGAIRFDSPAAPSVGELPSSASNRELTDAELDKAAGGIGADRQPCPFCGSRTCEGNCPDNPEKKK